LASTSDATSGWASSHIVGKWWSGKSKKFLLHCERHSHSHGHSHSPEEYLTPTQRANREIAGLRKELR
jgi:hypothetical protein